MDEHLCWTKNALALKIITEEDEGEWALRSINICSFFLSGQSDFTVRINKFPQTRQEMVNDCNLLESLITQCLVKTPDDMWLQESVASCN